MYLVLLLNPPEPRFLIQEVRPQVHQPSKAQGPQERSILHRAQRSEEPAVKQLVQRSTPATGMKVVQHLSKDLRCQIHCHAVHPHNQQRFYHPLVPAHIHKLYPCTSTNHNNIASIRKSSPAIRSVNEPLHSFLLMGIHTDLRTNVQLNNKRFLVIACLSIQRDLSCG
jgi:hypothetical protein